MTPPALLTTSTQTEMKRLMCATALMTQRSRQTECCQGTLYNGQQPCHRKVRAGADFCHYHRAQMKKALVACMREAETTNMRNQQFASDVMQSVAEQASEQATREQQRRERAIADGEAHAATFQQANARVAQPDLSIAGVAGFVEQLADSTNAPEAAAAVAKAAATVGNGPAAAAAGATAAAPAAGAAATPTAVLAAAARTAPAPAPPPMPSRRRANVIDDEAAEDNEPNDDANDSDADDDLAME